MKANAGALELARIAGAVGGVERGRVVVVVGLHRGGHYLINQILETNKTKTNLPE